MTKITIETTECPRCKSELKVTVGTQPKTQWNPEKAFRDVERCQTCLDADHKARLEDEYKCERARIFKESGIDERYWSGSRAPVMSLNAEVMKALKIEEDEDNTRGISILRKWVKSEGGTLYCYGAQGSGKTCAAMAAAIDCINEYRPQDVQFLTERVIIGTYSRGSKYEISLIERSFDVEVLVLDDFGRHIATRGTQYLVEQYGDIFDARNMLIGPKRKTLITSQLQPSYSKITNHFNDAAVSSRLLSLIGGNHVQFKGEDRRQNEWVRK